MDTNTQSSAGEQRSGIKVPDPQQTITAKLPNVGEVFCGFSVIDLAMSDWKNFYTER